jgi:hypothetical protein
MLGCFLEVSNRSCSTSGSSQRSDQQRQQQQQSYRQAYSTSPTSKWKMAYTKMKRATVAGACKVKLYEQDHQLRLKTKTVAVHSYQTVKTATVQAANKTKEWNEKHQVKARTKHPHKPSAIYVEKETIASRKSGLRSSQ